MTVLAAHPFSLDAAIAGLLACPVCHGDLQLANAGQGEARLVCADCGREYPVVDGIPVLVVVRAMGQEAMC